jgi:serine/threonine protein kinase
MSTSYNYSYSAASDFRWSEINNYNDKLTAPEIEALDNFLRIIMKKIANNSLKPPLFYKAGQYKSTNKEYTIARDIYINSPNKIAIILKDILYSVDSQSKISGAYDPINQRHLVKREALPKEFVFYQYLANKPLKGVVEIHSTVKADNNKNIVFMHRYKEKDLWDILTKIKNQQKDPLSDAQKLNIISNLLQGLSNLHKIKLSIADKTNNTYEVPLSHRDLKQQNIFCEATSCVIGDFDLLAFFSNIAGTGGFYAPETLEFAYNKRFKETNDEFSFNKKYGPKADIWSLGLIIASILSSGSDSPLMLEAIRKTTKDLDPAHQLHLVLSQKKFTKEVFLDLAQELTSQQSKSSNPRIKQAWELVKKMLQEDPDRRPSAASLLQDISS